MQAADLERLRVLPRLLGGRAYLDVGLPAASSDLMAGEDDHRAPAVVLPDRPEQDLVWWDDHRTEFETAVQAAQVHVVVTQVVLNRPLLGSLVVAVELFSQAYPSHGLLCHAAVVDSSEPNVAWVFQRRGTRIILSDG